MKKYEKILKVLANINRLKILLYLVRHTDVAVGDIATRCNISYKTVSKHLGMLYQADVVDRSRRQTEMHYRISDTMHPIASTVIKYIQK
ncbi:MAG: metalloregulator ArsR/SmtB family transcription factor [Patescibacteria group bacterium]